MPGPDTPQPGAQETGALSSEGLQLNRPAPDAMARAAGASLTPRSEPSSPPSDVGTARSAPEDPDLKLLKEMLGDALQPGISKTDAEQLLLGKIRRGLPPGSKLDTATQERFDNAWEAWEQESQTSGGEESEAAAPLVEIKTQEGQKVIKEPKELIEVIDGDVDQGLTIARNIEKIFKGFAPKLDYLLTTRQVLEAVRTGLTQLNYPEEEIEQMVRKYWNYRPQLLGTDTPPIKPAAVPTPEPEPAPGSTIAATTPAVERAEPDRPYRPLPPPLPPAAPIEPVAAVEPTTAPTKPPAEPTAAPVAEDPQVAKARRVRELKDRVHSLLAPVALPARLALPTGVTDAAAYFDSLANQLDYLLQEQPSESTNAQIANLRRSLLEADVLRSHASVTRWLTAQGARFEPQDNIDSIVAKLNLTTPENRAAKEKTIELALLQAHAPSKSLADIAQDSYSGMDLPPGLTPEEGEEVERIRARLLSQETAPAAESPAAVPTPRAEPAAVVTADDTERSAQQAVRDRHKARAERVGLGEGASDQDIAVIERERRLFTPVETSPNEFAIRAEPAGLGTGEAFDLEGAALTNPNLVRDLRQALLHNIGLLRRTNYTLADGRVIHTEGLLSERNPSLPPQISNIYELDRQLRERAAQMTQLATQNNIRGGVGGYRRIEAFRRLVQSGTNLRDARILAGMKEFGIPVTLNTPDQIVAHLVKRPGFEQFYQQEFGTDLHTSQATIQPGYATLYTRLEAALQEYARQQSLTYDRAQIPNLLARIRQQHPLPTTRPGAQEQLTQAVERLQSAITNLGTPNDALTGELNRLRNLSGNPTLRAQVAQTIRAQLDPELILPTHVRQRDRERSSNSIYGRLNRLRTDRLGLNSNGTLAALRELIPGLLTDPDLARDMKEMNIPINVDNIPKDLTVRDFNVDPQTHGATLIINDKARGDIPLTIFNKQTGGVAMDIKDPRLKAQAQMFKGDLYKFINLLPELLARHINRQISNSQIRGFTITDKEFIFEAARSERGLVVDILTGNRSTPVKGTLGAGATA
ncbi:hypothetical protein HY407_04335 [Candidatus Gottesmanbacteria bacterium]|nr:hypothetical protein [Candidatus Gottesmanbacteria bacterium]